MQLSKLKISSKAFWDVNFNNLMKEYDKYPEFIIKKVFLYSTFQDIIAVYKYFGKQKIINTLTQVSYLPAKTLHFASLFKCS